VTGVSNDIWHDDEHLLASLTAAMREAEEVPPRFVEVGKAAFAWHNIDAELARLTYDSSEAEAEPAGAMRAQDASLRALTYATAELSIEIEITPDAVLGQVLPPQPGLATTYLASGPAAEAAVDEMGFFAIRPVPHSAFRLRCVMTSGLDVKTGLITP
jgi:hypothetical protein